MNAPLPIKSADEIWLGDLFSRRAEADVLISYIKSVGSRPQVREDKSGFTISVDADYGIGKSYFLRRLADHLSLDHPVAFVDAWSDDLADEPLTAIAATLRKALGPLLREDAEATAVWQSVAEKAGKVAKIVALGAAKKAVSLAITGAGTSALEEVLTGVPDAYEEATREAVKEFGKDASSDTIDEIAKRKSAEALMTGRINRFEEGQKAISELKASIRTFVDLLPREGRSAPIVVIIDELDRCRPTYALRLLEEAKHLFDVPGLVFVFGMNSDQLGKSVTGAYGPLFDGGSYLRRFINRQFRLSFPDTEPLIAHLFRLNGIAESRMLFPTILDGGKRTAEEFPASKVVSRYMTMYGMTARDAFSVVEHIQTCLAVSGERQLLMALLLPLIMGKVKGLSSGNKPEVIAEPDWKFAWFEWNETEPIRWSPEQLFEGLDQRALWSASQLSTSANSGDQFSQMLVGVLSGGYGLQSPLSVPSRYGALIEAVSSFTEPGN